MSLVEKGGGTQATFSEFGDLALVSPRERRSPQPRPVPKHAFTGAELLARTLDLGTRGEIRQWFGERSLEGLNEEEQKVMRLYFQPNEDGQWLSQSEVAAQLGWSEKATSAVSRGIKRALAKIATP